MAEEKINNEEIKDENLNTETANETAEETTAQEANENNGNEAEEPKELTVEEKLEKAEAEVADLKNQLLYKAAEFDNYRKRTLKEKADLILNGGEKTITAFLPVLDDFERAIKSNESTEDVAALREGFDLIFKKFDKILEGMGVKKIDTKDADFNVDYHEAVAKLPMGDAMKGKVIDCVQTGYTLNDKVIRYAKVAVGE